MTILFNNNITRISVTEKGIALQYSVSFYLKKVGKNFIFFPKYVKARCVRDAIDRFVCDIDDFNDEKYYIENNLIYYKPRCIIGMNDQSSHVIYFNNVHQLHCYVNEIKSKADHIIID